MRQFWWFSRTAQYCWLFRLESFIQNHKWKVSSAAAVKASSKDGLYRKTKWKLSSQGRKSSKMESLREEFLLTQFFPLAFFLIQLVLSKRLLLNKEKNLWEVVKEPIFPSFFSFSQRFPSFVLEGRPNNSAAKFPPSSSQSTDLCGGSWIIKG